MLVHTVLFWLRQDLDADEVEEFRLGLRSLGEIASAHSTYVGRPAKTPVRPVIDNSYDFALTVLLPSLEAHDRYQEDPIHLQFLKENKHRWVEVRVYDAQ